jgi:DNA-binding transcriptional ArsR family regulator
MSAAQAQSVSVHPLELEFARFLPAALATALVRQYVKLKERAWADDHEGVQEKGGKVAEHALRAAQHLAGQTMVPLRQEIKNMAEQCQILERLPRSAANDALRVVIPRVIATLYTLRSKRSGGHTASEVDPSRADAALTERMADWLIAEFFRLGSDLPLDQAEATVAALVERRIPVVYRTGNFRRVLRTDLSREAELLVLLYADARGATIGELKSWSQIPPASLDRNLSALEAQRLIRIEREGKTRRVFLLPSGERLVEDQGWIDAD